MNQVPQPTIVKKSDKKTKLILSLIFDGIGSGYDGHISYRIDFKIKTTTSIFDGTFQGT